MPCTPVRLAWNWYGARPRLNRLGLAVAATWKVRIAMGERERDREGELELERYAPDWRAGLAGEGELCVMPSPLAVGE